MFEAAWLAAFSAYRKHDNVWTECESIDPIGLRIMEPRIPKQGGAQAGVRLGLAIW
jgi:hypothetical protein